MKGNEKKRIEKDRRGGKGKGGEKRREEES